MGHHPRDGNPTRDPSTSTRLEPNGPPNPIGTDWTTGAERRRAMATSRGRRADEETSTRALSARSARPRAPESERTPGRRTLKGQNPGRTGGLALATADESHRPGHGARCGVGRASPVVTPDGCARGASFEGDRVARRREGSMSGNGRAARCARGASATAPPDQNAANPTIGSGTQQARDALPPGNGRGGLERGQRRRKPARWRETTRSAHTGSLACFRSKRRRRRLRGSGRPSASRWRGNSPCGRDSSGSDVVDTAHLTERSQEWKSFSDWGLVRAGARKQRSLRDRQGLSEGPRGSAW